jgi:hypothetical protein
MPKFDLVVWRYYQRGSSSFKTHEYVPWKGDTQEDLVHAVACIADEQFANKSNGLTWLRVEGHIDSGDEFNSTTFIARASRATEEFLTRLNQDQSL